MKGSNNPSAASTAWSRIESIILAAKRSTGLFWFSLSMLLNANDAQSQYLKNAISRCGFHCAR